MRRGRGGPGIVRLAAGTAVMAGTAGVVHHRQEQRYANQAAGKQAEVDQSNAAYEAQAQAAATQAQLEQMQAQMAAQQAQMAAQQQLAAQQAQFAAQQAAAQQAPPMAAAAPAASAGSDRIAKLQQLAELKQAGILSDAEFEAEKAKILAGG